MGISVIEFRQVLLSRCREDWGVLSLRLDKTGGHKLKLQQGIEIKRKTVLSEGRD